MNPFIERLLIRLGLRREVNLENALSMFNKVMNNLERVQKDREAETAALEEQLALLAEQQEAAEEERTKALQIQFNMRKLLEE